MDAMAKVGGLLTLAVLLGSPAVTWGAAPFKPGRTYCLCNCATEYGVKDLSWEKTYHCAVNGKSCTADGHKGTLNSCHVCVAEDSTLLSNCSPAQKLTVAPPPPPLKGKLGLVGLAVEVTTIMEQLSTPDLVSLPAPASIPPEGFCRRNIQGQLLVQVYNQGRDEAGASKTLVDFANVEPTAVDTPAIPGGTATELVIDIPNACFDANNNCRFAIGVDAENVVAESEETNNNAAGLCGPQFQ